MQNTDILYAGQHICPVCNEKKPFSDFPRYDCCYSCYVEFNADFNVKYEVLEIDTLDLLNKE